MNNNDVISHSAGFKIRLNGTAVRVIREMAGITAAELARRTSLSPGYLSRLEQGSRQTGAEKIATIANALGVPREAISYPDFIQQAHAA